MNCVFSWTDGVDSLLSGARESWRESRQRRRLVDQEMLLSCKAQSRYFRKSVEKDYDIYPDQVLGLGLNGAVVVAKEKCTGQARALKRFDKRAIKSEDLELLRNEVSLNLSLDHPNIANALCVYEDRRTLTLVMELYDGGDLFERSRRAKAFSEAEVQRMTREMAVAIAHTHEQGVIHRDIKLENWIFQSTDVEAPLKLIDFGMATYWDGKTRLNEGIGTLQCMAPETIRGFYTEKVDTWALGVCVYALLAGHRPFHAQKRNEVVENILNCNYSFEGPSWADASEQAKDFIRRLLVVKVDARMSAAECLRHPWLAEVAHDSGELKDLGGLSASRQISSGSTSAGTSHDSEFTGAPSDL